LAFVVLGQFLVTLANSPELLRSVIGVVQAWLSRHQGRTVECASNGQCEIERRIRREATRVELFVHVHSGSASVSALTTRGECVDLMGLHRAGKTVLALKHTYDAELRSRLFDGMVWTRLGRGSHVHALSSIQLARQNCRTVPRVINDQQQPSRTDGAANDFNQRIGFAGCLTHPAACPNATPRL
jgi:hypothetical protein